ncbi:Uncharacterised protein g3624 [Pycnogonum litorale]
MKLNLIPALLLLAIIVLMCATASPIRRRRRGGNGGQVAKSSSTKDRIYQVLDELINSKAPGRQRRFNDLMEQSQSMLKQSADDDDDGRRGNRDFRHRRPNIETETNKLIRIPHRRKFPEVDSRGFDEDIFDEGFGEFSPMKR